MLISEFNADGDVTGPYKQAALVKDFTDRIQNDPEKWFIELREQKTWIGRCIVMPNFSFTKSIAARIALYESRLQQRGPPVSAIFARANEVIRLLSPQASCARGLLLVIILTNIPVLMPAPHAPQLPHAPPGTCLPLRIISVKAHSKSTLPPAFLYAVIREAPTMI